MAEQQPWWYIPVINGIFQTITWLTVICGWFIVNRQNNHRELRKETRSTIEELKERLEKLEQTAITFHCSEFDSSKSKDIVREMQRLSQIISRLKVLSDEDLGEATKSLRRSITLKNFDKSSHKCLSEDSPVLDRIYRTINELIDDIEYGFSRRFH
ncbi:hypothetical protein [Methylomonas sp. YC3]